MHTEYSLSPQSLLNGSDGGGGGRNDEIESVLITMSRKGNVLCQVCRVKNRYKLLDLRVIRIIKVKIGITSDKKVFGSSGGERQLGIELSKKERERNRLARFRIGRRRTVYIENSEFRVAEFQSDITAIFDLAQSRNVDLFALTETWITSSAKSAELRSATPPGFSLISCPRPAPPNSTSH